MESSRSSRRQWLAGLLRWGAVSALAAVTAVLIRRPGGDSNGHCTQRLPCERCGSLARCPLPQAVTWRVRAQTYRIQNWRTHDSDEAKRQLRQF